ncbi:hypothetical protein [Methylobacterium sp. JK268]
MPDGPGPRDLAGYPYVVVRVACPLCPHRQGSYRLARLAAKFGPDRPLDEVLDRIAFDCPWRPARRPGNPCVPVCKARFVDLDASPRPPDLPPGLAVLRLVRGGKS